ncbi:MAG TPA: VOC family protein [Candidatus Acidoferrum sp.]|nr:VOC family protein [Candidatus Acidoferrum sp.]
MKFDICIDVDDVARAVDFYGRGLGFAVVENHPDWAQLKLGEQTFWVMKTAAGKEGSISRDFRRHWTPLHLDLQVDDLEEAVKRALKAGGKLDREIQHGPKSNIANLSDPSGNGIDLVESPKK